MNYILTVYTLNLIENDVIALILSLQGLLYNFHLIYSDYLILSPSSLCLSNIKTSALPYP